MTVQETLEADIATAKADLAAKEASLEKLKTEGSDLLTREWGVVKGWFEAVKAHL
jgi:hypothetical protein